MGNWEPPNMVVCEGVVSQGLMHFTNHGWSVSVSFHCCFIWAVSPQVRLLCLLHSEDHDLKSWCEMQCKASG